jgi:DNA-binding NarL/FixJ family response regulator
MKMTKREEDVMGLLVLGLSNKKIGKAIGLSDHTVRDHVSSLLKKYDSMNRVELVAKYLGQPRLATK